MESSIKTKQTKNKNKKYICWVEPCFMVTLYLSVYFGLMLVFSLKKQKQGIQPLHSVFLRAHAHIIDSTPFYDINYLTICMNISKSR